MPVLSLKTVGCPLKPRVGDGEPGRERFRWLVWKNRTHWAVGFGTPDVYAVMANARCFHDAIHAINTLRWGHTPAYDAICRKCPPEERDRYMTTGDLIRLAKETGLMR